MEEILKKCLLEIEEKERELMKVKSEVQRLMAIAKAKSNVKVRPPPKCAKPSAKPRAKPKSRPPAKKGTYYWRKKMEREKAQAELAKVEEKKSKTKKNDEPGEK